MCDGVMSCRVVSCHVVSCHVVSCRVMSCHVVSCGVVSCHVMSCRVASRRVASRRIVSCLVMSHCVVSCRVMSYRVVSYRMSSFICLGTGINVEAALGALATGRNFTAAALAGLRLGVQVHDDATSDLERAADRWLHLLCTCAYVDVVFATSHIPRCHRSNVSRRSY